jgi:hypothetical protein
MTDDFATQDYTVTISGAEREEGHAPWTYVVTAPNWNTACEYALHAHVDGAPAWRFLGLRIESTELGAPSDDCGYAWNDLRPKRSEVTNES